MGSETDYVNEVPEQFSGIPSEMVQLLMQLGYVACGQGKPSAARIIFKGVAAVRPNSELPLIGLAIATLHQGKLDEAMDILLKNAARINPKNQITKALLGMLLRMAQRFNQSNVLLQEVIEDGNDSEAVALAKELQREDFSYLYAK